MKMLLGKSDTIVAIASAQGDSAIGIIRLSGLQSIDIFSKIISSPQNPKTWQSNKLMVSSFNNIENGELIDRGMAVIMRAPASYTGEDSVELYPHGGAFILEKILQQLVQAGARLAEPGEFTFRAYLNEKMDLLQAEAVADIIHARSDLALRCSQRQLSGRLSSQIQQLRQKLLFIISRVEAAIDFPEEDIEFLGLKDIATEISSIQFELKNWLKQFTLGKSIREGFRIALIGAPNVGKSSLLNRLVGSDRAIVNAKPGTTRDVIDAELHFAGTLLHFYDTAGLRQSPDEVELEGMRRTYQTLDTADLILHIFDVEQKMMIAELSDNKIKTLPVLNKIDLLDQHANLKEFNTLFPNGVLISAHTGSGIEKLLNLIIDAIGVNKLTQSVQNELFTNTRHRLAIESALVHISHALKNINENKLLELVAEDLRGVNQDIASIIGEIDANEVLSKIFSDFCVGK